MGATSHQMAAPRARFDCSDRKIIERQHLHPHAAAHRPGPFARRSGWMRKSALDSRSCSCFCPAIAVDTAEPHDKIEKAQKMREFNDFGVFSPPRQALWYSSGVHRGVSAKRAQQSEDGQRSRTINGVSGRTRIHLDGFGMQRSPRLCATSRSSSGKRLANPLSQARSEAIRQHRSSLSARYGMSVAVFSAMRVADPSAQPGQEEAE